MKKLLLYIFLFFIALAANAQTGIHFLDSLSWAQVKAKAKAENKYIFVDCYATWCGPCKFMAQTIFTQAKVGDYFTVHFESVSLQMDQTKGDDAGIRARYGDAAALAKSYGVDAYPTFLFFSPDGSAVHRIVGSSRDADDFLTQVANVFDPDKQYYTVIGQYKNHLRDTAFLHKALLLAASLNDQSSQSVIGDRYFESLKDPYTNDAISLFVRTMNHVDSRLFRFFTRERKRIDQVAGPHTAENALFALVVIKVADPVVSDKDHPVNWANLSAMLYKKYPIVAERSVLNEKEWYFSSVKKNVPLFERAAITYLQKYGGYMSDYELNAIAWDLFTMSNSRSVLLDALTYSKKSVSAYPNIDWEYADTYANLLYKTGNRDQAVAWENKAIAIVPEGKYPDQKATFETNLKKMLEGKKTWN